MKTKTFDCVELQHRGAENIRSAISVMTKEEELTFWRERSQALKQLQKKAREEHNTPGSE